MRKQSLSKMNTNQLRDMAVELGVDRKRLYGTSKQAMIMIIHDLQDQRKGKEQAV